MSVREQACHNLAKKRLRKIAVADIVILNSSSLIFLSVSTEFWIENVMIELVF